MKVLRNLEHLEYTFEHRRAFAYTARKLFGQDKLYGQLAKRARYHDLDKALLYSLLDKKSASAFHKLTSRHHIENDNAKSRLDLLEAYVDWDCNGYTKPDKTGNAWDALHRLNLPNSKPMKKVAKWYGIDWSYEVSPQDEGWKAYSEKTGSSLIATKAAIAEELDMFCAECPDTASAILQAASDIEELGVEAAARRYLAAMARR